MTLKHFTINFKELAKEISNRFDIDFVNFNKVEKEETYPFRDFFEIERFEKKERLKLLEGLGDNNFYYSEIGNATKNGDVVPKKLSFLNRNELVEDYFKKIEKGDIQKAKEGNILLAKVRPNLKKYIFIDEEKKDYFYTTAFINLKPKKLNKILYYSLRTIFYSNLIAISRQGKGYPTLNENDLFTLRFNKKVIDKFEKQQDQIMAKIEPIEQTIKELKKQIKEPQKVINKVFARELGLDLEKFKKLKEEKFFEVNSGAFGCYYSLRTDVKNHKYMPIFNKIISKFDYFELKKICLNDPMYGANEPAKEGKKGFDIRYIRITDIDELGNLIDDDWKTSENFNEKYLLKDSDFLFARSGNTVGKSFIYNSQKFEKAIFAGYFIKFVLNFDYLNKDFFLFYTKSFIFDFWKNGIIRIKGQPNINANEYLELKIPNIPSINQQNIVDEIKAELDKQEEINKRIKQERNKIDEIIKDAIK